MRGLLGVCAFYYFFVFDKLPLPFPFPRWLRSMHPKKGITLQTAHPHPECAFFIDVGKKAMKKPFNYRTYV